MSIAGARSRGAVERHARNGAAARSLTALNVHLEPQAPMHVTLDGFDFDVDLAASRVSADLRDDWFPDPVQFADRLRDSERLGRSLSAAFQFSTATDVNIPKPGFTVRYSLEQDLLDRVVYQGIANEAQHLDKYLSSRVFGYRVRAATGREMFQSRVQAWLSFNATVSTRLKDEGGVLLAADVQNYFEAIRHDVIADDLLRLDPKLLAAATLLKAGLRKWTTGAATGIPQNRDASSFLANLYLRPIDKHMEDRGFRYFRYMDDIRIICKDRFEGRRALLELISELRERGLNVNSRKTMILERGDSKIMEVVPEPDREVERFDALVRARRAVMVVQPMVDRLEGLLEAENGIEGRTFRATLERVRRIASSRYKDGVDLTPITGGLLQTLTDHPWHTDLVASYLRYVPLSDAHEATLADVVSDTAKYPYAWQSYHVWLLLAAQKVRREGLLELAVLHSGRAAQEDIVRAAGAIVYIGACGSDDDRVRLASHITRYPPNRSIRRALVIATQEVDGLSATRYLDDLPPDEAQLREFLRVEPEPRYAALPHHTSLSPFTADLPDDY
jgi:hypothetical protein